MHPALLLTTALILFVPTLAAANAYAAPRVWARTVVPAQVRAAVRLDHITAAGLDGDEDVTDLVDAVAARLGVRTYKGNLVCPGCGSTGEYAPIDPWESIERLRTLTGFLPWVVRAVCMSCGTATIANEETTRHYIPGQTIT